MNSMKSDLEFRIQFGRFHEFIGIVNQNWQMRNANKTHRKPCSCFLRYAEWSKKSFRCGISIFCPLIRKPPSFVDFPRLLLLAFCLLDFEWCVPLLLLDKLRLLVELFVVTIAVWDSDTSRLDNDLLVNDNFSVVDSRKLLGEFKFAVVCVCSVAVTIVRVELPSDKSSAVVWEASLVTATTLKLFVVVLTNEVILESENTERKRKGGFSLNFLEAWLQNFSPRRGLWRL